MNVVPLRRRVSVPLLSSAAAVAAVAALAVGVWATSVSRNLDDARSELALLTDPNARTFETAAGEASLKKLSRFEFPCPPTPMCPVTIRSFAPKADAGMIHGAANAVAAADAVCDKNRRRVECDITNSAQCVS